MNPLHEAEWYEEILTGALARAGATPAAVDELRACWGRRFRECAKEAKRHGVAGCGSAVAAIGWGLRVIPLAQSLAEGEPIGASHVRQACRGFDAVKPMTPICGPPPENGVAEH